jgi:hypothetical protein
MAIVKEDTDIMINPPDSFDARPYLLGILPGPVIKYNLINNISFALPNKEVGLRPL